MPPLGVCEQAPLAAPATSEVSTQEGTATEHDQLMLSLPWEDTQLLAATAKCSGHFLPLPEDQSHFPGHCN